MNSLSEQFVIKSADFFYIHGVSSGLMAPQWVSLYSYDRGLLCINGAKHDIERIQNHTSVIIGQRHENGDGLNCRIILNDKGGAVSFETDIAGGVPVFWYATNDIIIVTSGIELLITLAKNLDIRLEPNLPAFSELLIASYIYTEMQTGVKDVQLLPPKTRLKINRFDNRVEIQKIGPEFTYSNDILEWENAKNIFRKGLIEGFKRNVGKKVACLLSGGADSRIAALSAITSGIDVDFYTFGQSTVNVSDFYVANHIGYRLGKKVNCYSTSASDFIRNWKHACSTSNWINDSVWWAGRIPAEIFSELQKYDVIIRGDGDGIYGWKSAVANVSDILHRLEISEIAVAKKHSKYFEDPKSVFDPAEASRKDLINKYEKSGGNLRDLKNILYQKIREPRGIAPGIWHFSGITSVDAPLLWHDSLLVAERIPKDKRYDKQIIFEVLKTYAEVKDVPFSQGGSWDNQLEFYYSGVWEELIDYIAKHSPFPIKHNELRRNYVRPPVINIKDDSPYRQASRQVKHYLLGSELGRKTAFKYFSHRTHSSMSERLPIRLALISNLCELIRMDNLKNIVTAKENA